MPQTGWMLKLHDIAKPIITYTDRIQVEQHHPRCAPASCKPEHSNVRAAQGRACATILDKNHVSR